MADAYTAQGFTKPEPGSSISTWGTKLNTVIDQMARMLRFSSVSITGVAATDTLVFTNASTTASALPFGLKLVAGGVSAAFDLTLPAVDKYWVIQNVAGYTATAKVSGGTGVTISTGGIALVGYSSVAGDIVNYSPTRLPGDTEIAGALQLAGRITNLTAGVNASDGVNKGQMEAAISVLAGVIAGGLLLNSSSDTAAGYNIAKNTMASDSLLTYTTRNAGANEYQELSDRRTRRRAYFIGQV